MKRVLSLIMTLALITLSFTDCGEKDIKFPKDAFLKYTYSPAGECLIYESFDTNAEVYTDGTVKLYCDDFAEQYADEYPTNTLQLSSKEVAALKRAIIKNRIMTLPEDVGEDCCDGSYFFLTVYTENEVHKTGGLNVGNKRFDAVKNLLLEMVEEDFDNIRGEVLSIQAQGFEDEMKALEEQNNRVE